jgi:hypothetical protein
MPKNGKPAETETAIIVAIVRRQKLMLSGIALAYPGPASMNVSASNRRRGRNFQVNPAGPRRPEPMTLIHSWCTCGFPIKTSRTGRWLGRPSTMSARRKRLKFRLGEPFGRRPRG